ITIAIPVYNETKTNIVRTIDSLMNLDYPKEKFEIIVVNDGSTDNTADIVRRIIKQNTSFNIKLIDKKKNAGKVAAVNSALEIASGDFFGVVDADSRVDSAVLKKILPHFNDPKMGGIISVVKVDEPKNVYEKLQRVEYILSNLIRRLMASVDTLFLTHGVMCVFNKAILKKIGGFSKDSAGTEDLELALRLKKNGYLVRMEWDAIGYTHVPNNWKSLWRQRIRWFRGFIYNHLKYRSMFFSKKYGLFGMFQLPVNVLAVLLLISTVAIVSFGGIRDYYELISRSLTIPNYFIEHVLDFPTLNQFFLGQNVQITFPLVATTLLGALVIYIAHAQMKEKILCYLHWIFLYFLLSPYITTLHWLSAIAQEITRNKRKW
ncbi:MAG: glycosyltransferase family 2 protein, partial [Candidatus Woesearchaeota archaeon]